MQGLDRGKEAQAPNILPALRVHFHLNRRLSFQLRMLLLACGHCLRLCHLLLIRHALMTGRCGHPVDDACRRY